jgi:ABC-2 type transport system ATP-binding protein
VSARRGSVLAAVLGVLLALAATPGAAPARDLVVRSFDGTQLQASFFPAAGLAPGQRAPTVLVGHGWGGKRDTNAESASSDLVGTVGLGPLRHAGYNVLTWDARGWNGSGGRVELDGPDAEGRDVSALIDAVARQPEALLDGPNDPRVGMHGASYAGGIELVAAALDSRIDAIAPSIAWHSLRTSLLPGGAFKQGWASALLALARAARLDPRITDAFDAEQRTGTIPPADLAWFRSRGPGGLVARIRAPTLLLQGTVDTLFPLQEAIDSYRILRAHRVPVAMRWFCGGHGLCNAVAGRPGATQRAVLTWFARWLKRDPRVSTGPRFAWVMDDGSARGAPDYPLRAVGALRARGRGVVRLSPDDTAQGLFLTAVPARRPLNVAIRAPRRAVDVVGAPRVALTYRGRARGGARSWLFAQLVERASGNRVLGNQVTPIPIVLDGRRHMLRWRLQVIATRATRFSRYVLQLADVSSQFAPQRVRGSVRVLRLGIALPVVR